MTDLTPGLDARWNHVVQELHEAEKKAGRSAGDVTLLAVGKTFSAEALFECAKLGARAFGVAGMVLFPLLLLLAAQMLRTKKEGSL